uniref:TlpA family protein disulfide reductase n=1 Tax=Gordonia sp. B7-2 TaxID=3420932 RepID=UPI003D8C3000
MNDTSTTPEPGSATELPHDGETRRPSRFPPAARWTLVFVVVMLALIVAIWPRGGDPEPAKNTTPIATGPRATDAPVSDAELARARQDAAIDPCPTSDAAPGPDAVLAGVVAPCLADGTPIDVGAATAQKPLVINIWATWCLPCRKELPYFEQFTRRAGDRVDVMGVHAQQGASSQVLILKYLSENGIHLPSVLDTDGKVSAALGAPPVFPSTILVRPDGTVAGILPILFHSPDEIAAAVSRYLGVTV